MPRPASTEVLSGCRHGAGPRLTLEWDKLGCAYSTAGGIKTVLQDVSGAARPCQMQALMGPSGAGKSTLLDILAARKSVGRLAGTVSVNGKPRGSGFARHTSYVPQEDTFLPTMTVGETCALHAALTLPRGTPQRETEERIAEVLAAMGMLHARDTLVGGVLPGGLCLRGLSGGERKRVSIAVGILAAPSIIFLDEPTSGLDSCSALSVVQHLKRRALDGSLTIVASIHQPRAAVWAEFDTCSVLSGGMLLYSGECSRMVSWFESIGMGPWQSAKHGTASDWIMDLVNIGFVDRQQQGHGGTINSRAELETAARRFAEHYESSRRQLLAEDGMVTPPGPKAAAEQLHAYADGRHSPDLYVSMVDQSAKRVDQSADGALDQAVTMKLAALETDSASSPVSEGSSTGEKSSAGGVGEKRRRPSWWTTFRALLWRELLGAVRNPADVAGRMMLFAYMGFVCGLVFWRIGESTGVEGVRNRANVLFIICQQFLLMPYVYMSLYSADKRHFTADIAARLYKVSPYYVAKSLAVLPFILLNVLVCTFIMYGMTGLRLSAAAVCTNGGVSVLLYLIAQQLQSMASIVMPNEDASFLVTIMWSAFNTFFAGFIQRFDDMNLGWLRGLRWASANNYAFSAYIKAEFGGASYSCAGGLVQPGFFNLVRTLLPETPQLRSSVAMSVLTRPGEKCVVNTDAILDYFGVNYPMWVYFLGLAAYLVVVHAGTFCGLLMLARKERR